MDKTANALIPQVTESPPSPLMGGKQPEPLTDEELETLRPFISRNPFMAESRLLATIDFLKQRVKYLQVVKP